MNFENFSPQIESHRKKKEEILNPPQSAMEILRLPGNERRVALEEFKERIAAEKKNFAKFQEEMIELIRLNPDMSAKDLQVKAFEISQQKGIQLTKQRRKFLNEVLKEYEKRHRRVQKLIERHPGSVDLFRYIFKIRPKGKIEVAEGPMTILFRCFNEDDFFEASRRTASIPLSPLPVIGLGVKDAQGLAIVGSFPTGGNIVLLENVSPKFGIDPAVRLHEEQHAMNNLLRIGPQGLLSQIRKEIGITKQVERKMLLARNEKECAKILRRNFLWILRFDEPVLRDQLVAFLKGGTDIARVRDFFVGNRRSEWPQLLMKVIENFEKKSKFKKYIVAIWIARSQVLDEDYPRLINSALSAFAALRRKEYSIEETIACFMYEPLQKWRKIAQRLIGEWPENVIVSQNKSR